MQDKMMDFLKQSFFLLIILSILQFSKSCVVDDFKTQTNLDVSKILGEWKAYMWLQEPRLAGGSVFHDYYLKLTQKDNFVEKYNLARVKPSDECCRVFDEKFLHTDDPATFEYERNFNGSHKIRTTIAIMSTDYDGYLIIHGCQEVNQDGTCDRAQTVSTVYTREPEVSAAVNQTITTNLEKLCLQASQFEYMPHGNECKTDNICGDTSGVSAMTKNIVAIVWMIMIIMGFLF